MRRASVEVRSSRQYSRAWGWDDVILKVEDLFRVGAKTIFSGKLDTQSRAIAGVNCAIEIDGSPAGEVRIEGEVHTGQPCRDLWTTSPVQLTREVLGGHDIWLISR